jgi:pimeloyl-ACP methyl ester carboxylesterase
MGANPSVHKGDDLPVENVSWWDAIRYCNARSLTENLDPCYDLTSGACDRTKNGYRLLTDAEWTYASGEIPSSQELERHANLGSSDTKDTSLLLQYERTHSTKPVGRLLPNHLGLFDMFGNVWEWVQDFQDPSGSVSASRNPQGPRWGTARVVRGGSYLTTTSRWGRNFRSSMEPWRRSRFTGFRVARSLPESGTPRTSADWISVYQQRPPGLDGQIGELSDVMQRVSSVDDWTNRSSELRVKWSRIIGEFDGLETTPAVRHIVTHHEPTYTGDLYYLQVEPDYWEKIYIMIPVHADRAHPLPVVVVPYYDVDAPAGKSMGGQQSAPLGVRSFGHLAVQRGMAAVAIRWFGQSYGENAAETVANLKIRHPNATGMGKWVSDARKLLDYLATRPEFDISRVGMMGHSLGGKLTLYAAAMDDRIRVAVSSEPGIGLKFSNYEDFWYLGEAVRELDPSTDHHELLALIAPRPFLLIGGDSADSDKSWHYINAAQRVYSLLGAADKIGYLNHRKGHSPTPEAVHLAMEWLSHFLIDSPAGR